jgi:hypothetical protein
MPLIQETMKGVELSMNVREIKQFSEETERFSRSDIAVLVRRAEMAQVNTIQRDMYFCEWNGKL